MAKTTVPGRTERKKNLSKDKMRDDFAAYLFTAAERKEMDAIKKKAQAEGRAKARKKGNA